MEQRIFGGNYFVMKSPISNYLINYSCSMRPPDSSPQKTNLAGTTQDRRKNTANEANVNDWKVAPVEEAVIEVKLSVGHSWRLSRLNPQGLMVMR